MNKINNKIRYYISKIRWAHFYNNYKLPNIKFGDLFFGDLGFEKPIIIEGIDIPPYRGDHDLRDYSIMIQILKKLNPELVLELGTAYGNTVANICSESQSKVVTINALPEQIEGEITTFTLDKNEIGYVYKKFGFSSRVTQIYENTRHLDILRFVPPKSIDFAIIDACHDADFVVNDFMKILPSLSDKAIVLLHDTHPSMKGHYIGSYVGCMYLRAVRFNIRYIEGSSWGIWTAKEAYLNKNIQQNIFRLIERFFLNNNPKDRDLDIKNTFSNAVRFKK